MKLKIKFSKRTLIIVGIVVGVVVFLTTGYINSKKSGNLGNESEDSDVGMTEPGMEEPGEPGGPDDPLGGDEMLDPDSDAYLISMQPELVKSYGKLPDGYIWSMEGELFSLGDKEMTAEDVVYAYLTGIRTLDLSTAQKYSRGSSVVETYQGYFDSVEASEQDYYDSFIRSMYKEALLSIKVKGIRDSAVFAENKEVFTVDVEMLDLTDKDFWLKDKKEIYDNLFIYQSDEDDSTKSEMYLYDYVLKHYQSKKAKTRNVTFDITVERYPDLDTGWLVSIDKDVNDACMYSEGTIIVNYISDQFLNGAYEEMLDKQSGISDEEDEGNAN